MLILDGKIAFLGSLDMLSVPTTYPEPKGIFALEAMANRVPVVLPSHGSFPELVEASAGGILVEPHSEDSLVEGLRLLIDAPERAHELGERGRDAVVLAFSDTRMAAATADLYRSLIAAADTTPPAPEAAAQGDRA